ncbi:MAG TPA: hypothetical protein VF782_11505 [Allosphingosinicella sp.]|jgi:hypothetical protein
MAGELQVTVHPVTDLKAGEEPSQRLFAKLVYVRELEIEATGDEKPTTVQVGSAVKAELDSAGQAHMLVDDRLTASPVTVAVETAQGTALWTSEKLLEGDRAATKLKVAVPNEILAAQKATESPAVTPRLVRSGHFVRFDDKLPQYSGHRLFVAPIGPAADEAGENPQTKAARVLLGLDGDGDIEEFEVLPLDMKRVEPALANAAGFRSATIRADGSFEISLEIKGDEVGWAWMLFGTGSYIGYQVDRIPTEPRSGIVIILPPPAAVPAGVGERGAGTGHHSPSGAPPLDFDEQQLIDNPLDFGDDPGRNCSPFENPQRVLGERRFFTVLRVDQPEVGAESSLKVSRPIILDLAPPVRAKALASEFLGATGRETDTFATANLSRSFRLASVSEALAGPAMLARSVLDANIGVAMRTRWHRWLHPRIRQRAPVSARNPIEWEGDPTLYQATSVCGGHILEWRVQWRSNGYSLGDVAHSLTLAPRQTRRIVKVSWRRRESTVRQEVTQQRDQVAQATLRERDYSDAVQSSLSEWSRGGSSSSSTGVAGGLGFALGPFVIGGGAAHGRANSSSWQEGGRRVAASEEQSLRDAIRQFGDSVRRLESTIVTEVRQEEEVEGVSEIVRNVNYCHALTVLYHEILRHYRVDTAFAGLRECLFVPFSISPFDVAKALKWRDKLRHRMLARHLRWALDHLDEVANYWVGSDIPAGRRSQHRINYVTGSLYVRLSIERPRDRAVDEAEEAYRALWTRHAGLFGLPINSIIEQVRRKQAEADAWFQKEVAPTMAAKWADRLKLSIAGGVKLEGADCTLESSYRYGGTVRIDFTIPVAKAYNREDLQQIKVHADDDLPIGSVADLVRLSLHYYTDHFDTTAESARTTDDLNKRDTGAVDPQGADIFLPLTPWERQDLRTVIEDAVDELIVHLNSNLVYYHKVIMWLIDRDELFMLLDGFIAPYGRRFEDGKWVEDTGRSLASVVEREPIGILGNSLVFRVAGGVFLGINDHASPKAAHDYYHDSEYRSPPLRVSLPTEGLYAQALMDSCGACEEHFGSTDWVLSNEEPELESLAGQLGTRRASPEGTTPTPFPDTIISLQNAPAAPDPTGLGSILQAVTSSDSFRDMAGLAGTQANAAAALGQAASLAQGFGQMAVDFQKSKQATSDAKHKLSNIKKAQSDGLIDEAEAQRQSAKVLDEQNMTPAGPALTQDAPITQSLHRAGAQGQPIEVTRQTGRAVETVKIGRALGETPDLTPASFSGDKSATKLPSRIGPKADQAWEALAPIAPRVPGNCPGGIKNRGTLLFIHDAETEIDLEDYGYYTNADAWMRVHTVSDLIEGLRAYVGACGCVTGIHIEAHGGSAVDGGFRLGDDDNKNGHVEGTEATDFVSSAAQVAKFGNIIKNALCPGAKTFVSVASCMSAGNANAFIRALNAATGAIAVGTAKGCSSGGNWLTRAWWEADAGRVQVNADGTIKSDGSKHGQGIWKPF